MNSTQESISHLINKLQFKKYKHTYGVSINHNTIYYEHVKSLIIYYKESDIACCFLKLEDNVYTKELIKCKNNNLILFNKFLKYIELNNCIFCLLTFKHNNEYYQIKINLKNKQLVISTSK